MLLYQVFICGTYVLLQLCLFWNDIWTKLADKHLYKISIGRMRLRLLKLQESNVTIWKIKTKGLDWYEEVDRVLHYKELPFVLKFILTLLISRHRDNFLADYFGINKIRKLISRKYYWPTLMRNIKAYVKDYNIYLSSKTIRHKPFCNLQ